MLSVELPILSPSAKYDVTVKVSNWWIISMIMQIWNPHNLFYPSNKCVECYATTIHPNYPKIWLTS